MRTATPISTCSWMTERSRSSATSEVDLDAAVHRAGMHDQRVGLGEFELLVVEPEEVEIFADRRHEQALHALGLQAQHHDDVDVLQAALHAVVDFDAHLVDVGRHQGGRADHAHARAHDLQQVDVRARHPAVHDVAADRHQQALQAAASSSDGERVEQRLGRMLVLAVAGVDDGAVDLLRQEIDRARLAVAHDDGVGPHGVQGHRRVEQGLALAHRGGGDVHVDDVGAQPLGGDLEARARARRVLEEQVDDGAARQEVAPLVDGSVLVDVAFGKVEQARNGFRRQDPRCREGGATSARPCVFLSLKRDVKHAGAVLARQRLGG